MLPALVGIADGDTDGAAMTPAQAMAALPSTYSLALMNAEDIVGCRLGDGACAA